VIVGLRRRVQARRDGLLAERIDDRLPLLGANGPEVIARHAIRLDVTVAFEKLQ